MDNFLEKDTERVSLCEYACKSVCVRKRNKEQAAESVCVCVCVRERERERVSKRV